MADASEERRLGKTQRRLLLGGALLALVLTVGIFLSVFLTEEDEMSEAAREPTEQPAQSQREPTQQPTQEQQPDSDMPSGTTRPIVSFDALATLASQAADDPNEEVGRAVQLANLTVVSVLEDGTFYVSVDGSDERVLVSLDEDAQIDTEGTGAGEQHPDLDEGQTIAALEGTIEAMGEAVLEEQSPTGRRDVDEQIYVRADHVDVASAKRAE